MEASIEGKARQSFDAGFRKGEESARRAAEAELAATLQQLADSIAAVAGTRADTIRRAEADTVGSRSKSRAACCTANFSVDPSALAALIKAALRSYRDRKSTACAFTPNRNVRSKPVWSRPAVGRP